MNETLPPDGGRPVRLRPQRSFRLTGFGQPMTEAVTEAILPTGQEVLLKVTACGVCHSDLHLADGYFDLGGGNRLDLTRGIPLPRTLGHEIAGEVVAVGPDARNVVIGDRRVVFPWIGCGACALCQAGDEHLCGNPRVHGTTVDGGYSNYVTVPDDRYLLDYGDLPTPYAATLACSGLTAYSALRKAFAASTNGPVLIIGAGGVGSAAITIARALRDVGPVVADIDPTKREAALRAGAGEAVDPTDPEVRRRLIKQTGGGFGAAIDFVGAPASAEFGMALLRKGGSLIVVGLFGGALPVPLPMLPMRSLTLAGSYVGSLAEMTALMQLARSGVLQPMPVQRRPLGSVQAALDDLRRGRVAGRAVVEPEFQDAGR